MREKKGAQKRRGKKDRQSPHAAHAVRYMHYSRWREKALKIQQRVLRRRWGEWPQTLEKYWTANPHMGSPDAFVNLLSWCSKPPEQGPRFSKAFRSQLPGERESTEASARGTTWVASPGPRSPGRGCSEGCAARARYFFKFVILSGRVCAPDQSRTKLLGRASFATPGSRTSASPGSAPRTRSCSRRRRTRRRRSGRRTARPGRS